MGYCYNARTGGLVCDSCGVSTGVRKRTCPHKVDGLPYCPAPALCAECFDKEGKTAKIHARCKEPAARRQAECDESARMIDAGHLKVSCAWGSWHEDVPDGFAGVLFRGKDKEEYRLIPSASYSRGETRRMWLHEYDDAQSWPNHPNSSTKRIA